MDRAKRVVLSFLNSAEGYFHTKVVLENGVKQPQDLYGPKSDRPERWDYTDVRDITKEDLTNIVSYASSLIDQDLFKKVPDTALNAALQTAIYTYNNSQFQSKIDSNIYNFLYKILSESAQKGNK